MLLYIASLHIINNYNNVQHDDHIYTTCKDMMIFVTLSCNNTQKFILFKSEYVSAISGLYYRSHMSSLSRVALFL